jgi:hypothetical protein
MRRLMSLPVILLLALLLPAGALAAPPDRFVVDLNDPDIDVSESAFVSGLCGFDIDAQVSGHIVFTVFDDDSQRHVVELHHFGIRTTYMNVATGAVVRVRDIGPDRHYISDGVLHVAITGRSEGGTGIVGVVKINLETGEVEHVAGNDIGVFLDRLCGELS